MIKTWSACAALILLILMLGGCAGGSGNGGFPAVESRWLVRHGGLINGPQKARAQRLCNRICRGWIDTPVHVRIVDSRQLGAWSWSDGDVYLTLGLTSHLNNKELAAAIAHELGHLINSKSVVCPYALGSAHEQLGIEFAADLTGARVLAAHGIAPQNLVSVIRLLNRRSSNESLRKSLQSRIHLLLSEIKSGQVNKCRRNVARARDTRDRTVPTATSSTWEANS